jgi:hypothetical protein
VFIGGAAKPSVGYLLPNDPVNAGALETIGHPLALRRVSSILSAVVVWIDTLLTTDSRLCQIGSPSRPQTTIGQRPHEPETGYAATLTLRISSIILCSNVRELSNIFIQKGLAFRAERSGTGVNHGRQARSEILPRRLRGRGGASVVRPRGRMNRTEDLHVEAREETIDPNGDACACCKAVIINLWRVKE